MKKKVKKKDNNHLGNMLKVDKKSMLIAVIVIFFVLITSFILTGRLMNMSSGCTTAVVMSITPTTRSPVITGKYGNQSGGELRYKVRYEYFVGNKTYSFTETYSAWGLMGLKRKKSDSGFMSMSVDMDDISTIPIKYFTYFPWYHAVTNNCDED